MRIPIRMHTHANRVATLCLRFFDVVDDVVRNGTAIPGPWLRFDGAKRAAQRLSQLVLGAPLQTHAAGICVI